MSDKQRYVIGPDGSPLSLHQLPDSNTVRWTPRRKAEVICAVKGGLLTLDEARARWNLALEEYLSWESMIANHGLPGLRSTRTQVYR